MEVEANLKDFIMTTKEQTTVNKGDTLLYMRLQKSSLPFAETGSKPYTTYVGQHTEGSADRLYDKQFDEIDEPNPRLIINGIWDKDVHKILNHEVPDSIVERYNPAGKHNHGSDECFRWYVPLRQAYSILCEAVKIALERKKQTSAAKVILKDQKLFDPRPYQESFVTKFCKSTDKFFLLAMKCRSGKTCSAYSAMKKKDYKSVLVLSFYGSPIDGWISDGNQFNFDRVPILADNVRNPTWDEQVRTHIENEINFALIATAQFFSDDKKNIRRLKKVADHFDCIVLDECHFGGDSDSMNSILKDFPNADKVLEISATPFKALYNYRPENIFTHTYADEQRAKASGEEWAQSMPKMKLFTGLFDCSRAHELYPGYRADRIGNILSLNSPKVEDATDFYDEMCVKELIRFLFDRGNRNRHQYFLYYSNHIIASLPSNFACHLFALLLEKMNIDYKPLVINDGKTKTKDIINHCEKYDKTICLTYKGNVCGVTNPYWDTALFLHDYPSMEDWIQFALRPGSVKDRDFFTVIDLSPNRAIHSLYDMFSLSGDSTETTEDYVRQIVDMIDMNNYHEGYRKWTQEEIISVIAKSPDSLEQITNSLSIKVDMTDEDNVGKITNILLNLSADNSTLTGEKIQISDNETFNKSNLIVQRPSVTHSKKEQKDILKKIQTLKNSIVNLQFISELDGYHVDSFHTLLNSKYLEDILEISPSELETLVRDCGIFGPNSERLLNKQLSDVSLVIRDSLSSSETGTDCDIMLELIDKLFHAQQHRPLPTFLISEFYDSLIEQINS